jgi:hypothetical protein
MRENDASYDSRAKWLAENPLGEFNMRNVRKCLSLPPVSAIPSDSQAIERKDESERNMLAPK